MPSGKAEAPRRPLLILIGPDGQAGLGPLAGRYADDGYDARLESGKQAAKLVSALLGAPFGVIGFGTSCSDAVELAKAPNCLAAVFFDPPGPEALAATLKSVTAPSAVHLAGAGTQPSMPPGVRVHRYPGAVAGFVQEATPGFEAFAAGVAYSRTLELLKRQLGPRPDLAGLFREHLRLEFEERDPDATMKTMVDEPYVNHVPTMAGGTGHDLLKRFYKYHFIPTTPSNRKTIILNEIVGADAVVIEAINCFTHSEVYDHFLPGVPPTGKYVEVPFVAIARFRGEKLYSEQIYWDQASVLVQLGLLAPEGLPICGREQAEKVRNPALPSNQMMPRWRESEGKPI